MDDNTKKEEFSYGYIKMLSATSGLEVSVTGRPSDSAGIDITIKAPGKVKGIFSPRIDAQVKCTSGNIVKSTLVKYPLQVKNYKRLIDKSSVPQILIVLIVPKEITDWLNITEDETLVRRCAYWISLKGRKETDNEDNITIEIPKDNLLTPEILIKQIENEAERMKKIYDLENLS